MGTQTSSPGDLMVLIHRYSWCMSHLGIRWTTVSGLLLFMTPQCINQPKYEVVSVHKLFELSSYRVNHFPPSVSCLTMSASEVPWWIHLPGVSHFLTSDCHWDINLQCMMLSFFFFSSFFLVIWAYQFSGVFCLGAKVAQTFLWMELLCNHRDQLQTPDCSPLTTTQELQIWDVYASLKCLGISVQYLCMTPVWYRSAIATMTVTVTSL